MKSFKSLSKRTRSGLILVVAFAVIGTAFLVFTKAAGTATLSLTPASGTYNISTNFTVSVYENSGTVATPGVEVYLNYDATKLDFVSADTTGGVFTDCPVAPSGANGTVSFQCLKYGSTFTGSQKVGNVTFRAKVGTGTTAVTFGSQSAIYDASSANVWNAVTTGGTYTLATPDTTAPVITNGTPNNGAVLTTSPVAVNATITDDRGTVSSATLSINSGTAINMTAGSGGAYSYSWNTSAVADGSYTLLITAKDPAGNTSTATRTVTVQNAKPDLVVTGITLSPAAPKVGDVVTITATLKNQGNAATTAAANVTDFKMDNVSFSGPSNTASVAAGATYTATATWTATLGSHTVIVGADKNNVVTNESNESNNSLSKAFTVAKPGDATGDNVVNFQDALKLSSNWNKTGMTFADGDFNGDGVVNFQDALILSSNWNK